MLPSLNCFFNLFSIFLISCSWFQRSVCMFPLKELSNAGASGSIFYVSHDDQFIIKTVQSKEAEFLKKLLPGYYMVSVISNLSQQFSFLSF